MTNPNFFYVKLSCPKKPDDGSFGKMLDNIVEQNIFTYKISNIPNHLTKSKKGDIVFLHIGGDSTDKRKYLKQNSELKDYTNAWYGYCVLAEINIGSKWIEGNIVPFQECITKKDLYNYPQFLDNLGCASKGIATQAGLYTLDLLIGGAFFEFVNLNGILLDKDIPKDIHIEGSLETSLFDFYSQNENEHLKNRKTFKVYQESLLALSEARKTSVLTLKELVFAELEKLKQEANDEDDRKLGFLESEKIPSIIGSIIEKKVLNLEDIFYIKIGSRGTSHAFSSQEELDNFRSKVFNILLKYQVEGYFVAKKLKDLEEIDVLDKFSIDKIKDNFTTHIFIDLNSVSKKSHPQKTIDLPPTTPLPKPFLLLAGISGTGKTRFVREQAQRTGTLSETYCLVSVRPDWHEPSDLLGYTSRINDEAEYIVTDVLKFIVKAWKELFNAGISFDGKKFKGTEQQLSSIRPFWLCLDEMNLAPVEQYFADYLSILETRKWEWTKDGKEFTYSCDSLLKPALLSDFSDEKDFQLQNHIGAYETVELWEHFKKHGISIPFNLIVAGTVNMDETTHGFSRKVIDRALSFDFGEFFPNDFDAYFEPETKTKTFSYSIHSEARGLKGQFGAADPDGQQTIQFLKAINEVLEDTPFQLAYRALNELLLSSFSQQPIDEIELQAVWDDFLMQKVLPRIEGDLDKLSKVNTEQNILEALQDVLKRKKEDASGEGLVPSLWRIWDKERPDLHRETMDGETQRITCRSKAKLAWMSNKLENGFTSFWP